LDITQNNANTHLRGNREVYNLQTITHSASFG